MQGANILYGGERVQLSDPKLGGHFLSPCILTDVKEDMTVCKKEVFGSVLCILPFKTEEEVLKKANDTELGLAGAVFTR